MCVCVCVCVCNIAGITWFFLSRYTYRHVTTVLTL